MYTVFFISFLKPLALFFTDTKPMAKAAVVFLMMGAI
jgi:hypothetical protein